MGDLNNDDLFLDAVDAVVLDMLDRIGDDPGRAISVLQAVADIGSADGAR